MRHTIWRLFGMMLFLFTWPLIRLYIFVTPPRSRLLIVHDGSVLLVKNWLGLGHWSVPGGGAHRGENPKNAALREVQEELGLEVNPRAIVDHGVSSAEDQILLHSKFHLFSATILSTPTLRLQASEIMQAAWIPLAEIDKRNDVSGAAIQSVETWIESQNLV